MSRQYLKQLKERAQRLLNQSSEDEEDDEQEINAYTATQGTRSPNKIVLDDILPDQQQTSEFNDHETTDIELLKRCISLTNENNNLKFLVEKLSRQIDTLKADLKTSMEKEAALRKKAEGADISAQRQEELQKFEQAMQLIEQERQEIDKQKKLLKLQEEELKREDATIKLQWQQLQQLQKVGLRDSNRQNKQIQVHNDYTIRTTKREDYDKIKLKCEQWQRRCEELQKRMGKLQQVIRQQRSKANRLYKFINKEIPALNNIIIQLTAKLDAKLQRQILNGYDI